MNKQITLIILDGWGHSDDPQNNAVAAAATPFFDSLLQRYPNTLLYAGEEHVGLPKGQMGNSEVCHTTIGTGMIIDADLVRIAKDIDSGAFEHNPEFIKLFDHVKQHDSTLHIKGLLSDGGVHSHKDHLFAFLRAAKLHDIEKVVIHIFTDGRDTAPQSSVAYIEELEHLIDELGIGYIATATGRFYAMDRDNNWDRLKKAEAALFECKGTVCHNKKPSEVMAKLHKQGVLDEHLEPLVFVNDKQEGYAIKKNDGVFFFNFRSDRAKMFNKKIVERVDSDNLYFVTMTEHDTDPRGKVAFGPKSIETTLAAEIAKAGLRQSHIAETEKFAHVTYFFNGGFEGAHVNEKHVLLESHKHVATHDLAPEMRAEAIADKAIEDIQEGIEFVLINFANPDMVGHTGNVPAIIAAIEEVDAQLKRVVEAVQQQDGIAIITADHGNAEQNIDPTTGHVHTAHTLNRVPFIITADTALREGGLADIAPTILTLLSLPIPASMNGTSLLH